MDSLLATYASSDEEEDQQQPPPPPPKTTAFPSKPTSGPSSSSLFSSLPKPKPSSFVQSLPKPKQTQSKPPNLDDDEDEDPVSKPTSKPSSTIFSSLPKPKSQISNQPITNLSSSDQKPKRVVQFKPPINPYSIKSSQTDDEDEDDDDKEEEEERRRRKGSESSAQTASATSFLSTMPAPRNSGTLGALPSSGSGRRAIVETESGGSRVDSDAGVDQNAASYGNYQSNIDQNGVNYESYGGYESYQSGIDQNVDAGIQLQARISGSDVSNYASYDDYGSYAGYEQHGNDWVGGSATAVPGMSGGSGIGVKVTGKRGRNEIPTEIVEVKQDELMKNRPREDQVKLTGIAFGPSYQPVSTKGKPSKLHKRKHQIGSLFFDMKQKEMELAERRSRGFLTKAETQAKYGW